MAEWLYEAGIGENRAALVDGDALLAVRIERESDGLRYGAVVPARLVEPKIVELNGGQQLASLQGRAPVPLGGRFLVQVIRMAQKERGRDKLARVRVAAEGVTETAGPSLYERIAGDGYAVRSLSSLDIGPDRLMDAGWLDMVERAQRGHWEFIGGALWLDPTPAMMVIDIDGEGAPLPLARAGAQAAVAAITGFDIGGPIAIDFPSLAGRNERAEMDALIDGLLPQPFERTATNGFGLMQIIRRRDRPSFIEQIRYDAVRTDAALLLRQAERARGAGVLTLRARPAVIDVIEQHPHWMAALSKIAGRSISLQRDPATKGSGHAQ